MSKVEFSPETDGTRNGEPIYCPVNGWDCPYYKEGRCHIAEPIENCEDFAFFWPDWDEYDTAD